MDKQQATQDAVNAVAVLTRAINDYGRGSLEAASAHQAAIETTRTARAHGATDSDFRTTQPA